VTLKQQCGTTTEVKLMHFSTTTNRWPTWLTAPWLVKIEQCYDSGICYGCLCPSSCNKPVAYQNGLWRTERWP